MLNQTNIMAEDYPRFRQIADLLKDSILKGDYLEHSVLPSERNLGEQFNVSRMTARRALKTLESEGLAYSAGRKGRFVSPQRLKFDISNTVSFAADAQSGGTELEIELLSANESKADPTLAKKLSIPEGADIYEYRRAFKVKGHITFLETEYIVKEKFPDFLDLDLTRSTTLLMHEHYNVKAATGNLLIRMRSVTPQEALGLGVSLNQSVLELEMITLDDRGTAFSVGKQVWRGELAEFSAKAFVNR